MGGKRVDRSFLGESALRLGRFLGVGGLISPQFDSEEKIGPVVLVGDASGIGYRGQEQRAFAYGETVPAAAGFTSKLAVKCPPHLSGLIFDGFIVGTATTGQITLNMLGADSADPWAILQTNVLWVERMATNTERSGILTQPQNTDALSYGLDFARLNIGANAAPIPLPIPAMITPGGKIIIQHTVANALLAVTFWGRAL